MLLHYYGCCISLGSRVQCVARAVSKDGDAGLELSSYPITISKELGLCAPKLKGSVGAEPFTAKMRYTGNNKQNRTVFIDEKIFI